ncbi:MAG: DUF3800 domain-containing protein [Candidatus Pseudobacter hemicellulosilyticus]|uniref:DUF3800 domain-containing protein n=1 Tax=Candidatus Pseudobacter hemicellulosilyticus TaxID=3121375 RepID=A0AAJ5WT82_9BACT|nr:MAG: DUF3800 domain-containing protein [Pseudobacter sp.]
MGFFYVDDSVHDKAGFVLGACLYSQNDLVAEIDTAIAENGFDPKSYEFKSSANFAKQPKQANVRESLKGMLLNCKLGIVIVPREKRKKLGIECIKAVQIFINKNLDPQENIELYFDQGLFQSRKVASDQIDSLGFKNCKFNIEQDSKIIKGIQLADLAAHTASIYFKESLGFINKKVKAGPNSGYDEDLEIELGFEMWANLRYVFFNQGAKEFIDDPINDATLKVEPYGLYISEYCREVLAQKARETFAEVYLGCIH